jgi:acyl dehydratase
MNTTAAIRRPGAATEEFRREITREELRSFAAALGLRNPIHHTVDAGRDAGFRDIVAPISYILGFRIVPRDIKLAHFGIEESRAVAGEFAFEFKRPICAGDVLTARTVLLGVTAKPTGRPGAVLSFETAARDEQGELVLVARDTIIEFDA